MFATSAAIFSLLLILTGFAKLRHPGDVETAISALGVPRLRGLGLVIGGFEVVVGLAALLVPSALGLQSLMYLAFAVWVFVALRSNVPLASCGCLGKDDTPPSSAHVVLNVIAAGVSSAAAFGPGLRVIEGVGVVAQFVVVAAGLLAAYIVLTDGARLSGVRAR